MGVTSTGTRLRMTTVSTLSRISASGSLTNRNFKNLFIKNGLQNYIKLQILEKILILQNKTLYK